MADVSEEQVATRRRALGRKLLKHASDLWVMTAGIRNNQDCDFLDSAEGKSLSKQLDTLDKIAGNYEKLAGRLEGK